MIKVKKLAAFVGTLLLSATCSAQAQMSPNWNIEPREHAEANNAYAVSALNGLKSMKAIATLRKACMQDPNDPTPFATLGLALAMQGQYAEALDALQKSYTLRPSNEVLLSTGVVYYLTHDYEGAIGAWNKMLQSNPHLCNVYGNIAMAYLREGDLPKAQENFDHLVTCEPNSEFGYYGIALTNYLNGNFGVARESAQRAELVQSYPPAVLLLSKIDLIQGDVSRGRKEANHYNSMVYHTYQQRSMAEIGYPSSHDFHWDPFLADFYDNGNLVLAREEKPGSFWQEEYSHRGHARSLIAKAKQALEQGAIGQADTLQKSSAKNTVLSTGIAHSLHRDILVTHELGLAQLAAADYSGAAESFKAVLNACPACNVDLLYLARAQALDGKMAQASEQVHEFQKRQPSQELSSVFTEVSKVDPAVDLESTSTKRTEHVESVGPKPIPANEF